MPLGRGWKFIHHKLDEFDRLGELNTFLIVGVVLVSFMVIQFTCVAWQMRIDRGESVECINFFVNSLPKELQPLAKTFALNIGAIPILSMILGCVAWLAFVLYAERVRSRDR